MKESIRYYNPSYDSRYTERRFNTCPVCGGIDIETATDGMKQTSRGFTELCGKHKFEFNKKIMSLDSAMNAIKTERYVIRQFRTKHFVAINKNKPALQGWEDDYARR